MDSSAEAWPGAVGGDTSTSHKMRSCPGAAEQHRRVCAPGKGSTSSCKSQPGCLVPSGCTATPASTPSAAHGDAAAAASVFRAQAAEQATLQLAALQVAATQHAQATALAAPRSGGNNGSSIAASPLPGMQLGGEDEDMEHLFEAAEEAVDAFWRHPSHPQAARLFGPDFADALDRLRSGAAAAPEPTLAQQQQQLPATAAATAAGHHLSGAKRSKPSFSLSRDPAADRPHSRREVGLSSNFSSQAAGPGGAAAGATADVTPTPPPSATAAAAAAAAACVPRRGGRRWGLDLSDCGSTAFQTALAAGDPAAHVAADSSSQDTDMPSADNSSSHASSLRSARRSSSNGKALQHGAKSLLVAKQGLKHSGGHHHGHAQQLLHARTASIRRSSCPGAYLAAMHSVAEAAAAAAAAQEGSGPQLGAQRSQHVRVLDLSSPGEEPWTPREYGGAQPQPAAAPAAARALSPFAEPGTAHSSIVGTSGGGGAWNGGSSLQSKRSVGGACAMDEAGSRPASETCRGALQLHQEQQQQAQQPQPQVFVTITRASGQGPHCDSLTRRVSSVSPDASPSKPGSGGTASLGMGGALSGAEDLAAACAAAIAAVGGCAGLPSVVEVAEQPQRQADGSDDGLPKLRPIRTKSRAEGAPAVLQGTAHQLPPQAPAAAMLPPAFGPQHGSSWACDAAAPAAFAVQPAGSECCPSWAKQHQELYGEAAADGLAFQPGIFCRDANTPAVTPATAMSGAESGATAALAPESPGNILAAAAATLAPSQLATESSEVHQVAAVAAAAARRLSHAAAGTPIGLMASIAHMSLRSPALVPCPAQGARNSSDAGMQQQQQYMPAAACNGVFVTPADGGLVLVKGQQVTTGLIHAACSRPSSSRGALSSSGGGLPAVGAPAAASPWGFSAAPVMAAPGSHQLAQLAPMPVQQQEQQQQLSGPVVPPTLSAAAAAGLRPASAAARGCMTPLVAADLQPHGSTAGSCGPPTAAAAMFEQLLEPDDAMLLELMSCGPEALLQRGQQDDPFGSFICG